MTSMRVAVEQLEEKRKTMEREHALMLETLRTLADYNGIDLAQRCLSKMGIDGYESEDGGDRYPFRYEVDLPKGERLCISKLWIKAMEDTHIVVLNYRDDLPLALFFANQYSTQPLVLQAILGKDQTKFSIKSSARIKEVLAVAHDTLKLGSETKYLKLKAP